jgi:hypothetical protein
MQDSKPGFEGMARSFQNAGIEAESTVGEAGQRKGGMGQLSHQRDIQRPWYIAAVAQAAEVERVGVG